MLYNSTWFQNLPERQQADIEYVENLTRTTILEIRRLTHLTNINNTVVRQYIISLALQCRTNLNFIRTTLENVNELFSFQEDPYMTDWLTAVK